MTNSRIRLVFILLGRTSVLVALIVCLAAPVCFSQETKQNGNLPNAPSHSGQAHAQAGSATPFETGIGFVDIVAHKSLFFPDLATSTHPLSSGDKFKLFVSNSISGSAIFSSAAGAGIAQAADTPEGYGQGGEGYGKRFGSLMARRASSQFFGTWLLASALHQDPRYFVKPTSDIGVAVKYAVRRTFVTHDDRTGREVANWSGLLGPLLAEGLANAYMPPDAQTAGHTFGRYGVDIGVTAASNIVKQYWPTIVKSLRLPQQTPTTSTYSATR